LTGSAAGLSVSSVSVSSASSVSVVVHNGGAGVSAATQVVVFASEP
jgi:hypothetical protein